MKNYVHLLYLAEFLEWRIMQTEVVEKSETFYAQSIFSKNEIMWKNMIEANSHRWQYSAMHGCCMLDNSGCRRSEYVILAALPQQHILHRHISLLCLYICCLSCKLWEIQNGCTQGVHGNALTRSWWFGHIYIYIYIYMWKSCRCWISRVDCEIKWWYNSPFTSWWILCLL